MTPSAAQAMFHKLDALSRTRALTDLESLTLEAAIDELDAVRCPHTNKVGWTPQEDDKLRALVAQGWSFGGAGRELKRSKNSCLGRWRRLSRRQPMEQRA